MKPYSPSSVSGVLEVRVRLMSLPQIYQLSLVIWNVFHDRYLPEIAFFLCKFSLKVNVSQVFAAPSSLWWLFVRTSLFSVEFVSV